MACRDNYSPAEALQNTDDKDSLTKTLRETLEDLKDNVELMDSNRKLALQDF